MGLHPRTVSSFRSELEKTAVLGHLLAGPVGHVAVNALGRSAHHKTNLAEYMAHQGLQHGLTGSKMNPFALRSLRSIAGPESSSTYDLAHAVGMRMQGMHSDQQRALMQGALGAGAAHADAPIVGSLHSAMQHELSGTAPQLQSKGFFPKEQAQASTFKRLANTLHPANLYAKAVKGLGGVVNTPFDTTAQRVAKSAVGGAPVAALGALDPVGSAAHMGINAVREVAGNSDIGRRAMKGLYDRGAQGRSYSRGVQLAADYALSPALLDPMRLGAHVQAKGHAGVVDQAIAAYKHLKPPAGPP